MKPIALFAIFSVITKTLFAQTDSLKWSKDTLVNWSDYKAPIDKNIPFNAYTNNAIQYKYHCTSFNLKTGVWHFSFEVESYFLKNESWSIPDKQSDVLLQHERLHNDINELFARKLAIEFKRHTYTANYEAEIKELFARVLNAAQQMQVQYDEETNHCLNQASQAEWQLYVQSQLDRLAPHDH